MWKFGKKSIDTQMQKYMALYYPTTGPFTYEISFDWGLYTVTTEAQLQADVHVDSRPYRGYVTMRPTVTEPNTETRPPVFLITPDGVVWKNQSVESIPEAKTRQEVTEQKHGSSTTVQTTTTRSVSEPVIDHFRENPGQWTLYGTIEVSGSKSRLKLSTQ